MLADRVRMILGGKKYMKTYKIQLSTSTKNSTSYLDFQEDSLNLISNNLTTTPVEHEVSRYIPLALKFGSNGGGPFVGINGASYNVNSPTIQAVARIGFNDGNGPSVVIYDLEAISTITGIPIEDMESLKFIVDFH